MIVGSGKTATDACIWLLSSGVDPDAICWVRPRDPWMLNRAVVQPDPAVFLGMAADTMQAAAEATSLDDLFLRLEEAGVMLRIDRSVTPTMAKTPTLAAWELDRLRTIDTSSDSGTSGQWSRAGWCSATRTVAIPERRPDRALRRVRSAATRPLVPIWGSEAITLQPIRTGFPCFGAALAGYVEATRDDDAEKNRLCPPSPYANTTCRLGADAGTGHPSSDVIRGRARHQGLGRPSTAQPGAHTSRHDGHRRPDCCAGALPHVRRAGLGAYGPACR